MATVDHLIQEFKRNWVRNVQDKYKRWWMEIVLPNDVCIEPSEEMKKVGSNDVHPHILIRITWDNVIKYGKYAIHKVRQYGTYPDDLLRREMHGVRKAIASSLQKLCKSDCVWEMVGSDSNVSDVDINVFDDRVDQLKPLLQKHITTWLGGNRVDVLFDMNIYLSAFGRKEVHKRRANKKVNLHIQRIPFSTTVDYVFVVPSNSLQYEESQLIWGLVHLWSEVKGTQNEPYVDTYIQKSEWNMSWQKAKDLYRVLEKQKGNVEKVTIVLVKEAQSLFQKIAENTSMSVSSEDIERYMNVLSTIQYYSRETYLTRGAYFHVVMEISNGVKNLNLQPFEYMHSVVDNLSFIAELCNKDTLCPVQYTTIFAKISKYIYRICDALVKQGWKQSSGWDIVAIRDHSATLNALRKKQNVDSHVMTKQMELLHSILKVPFLEGEEYTTADLADIFKNCMSFSLAPFVGQILTRATPSKSIRKMSCSKNVCVRSKAQPSITALSSHRTLRNTKI